MAKVVLSGKFIPRIINAVPTGNNFDALLTGGTASRLVAAECRNVQCPQIDLSLYDFYRPTGELRNGLPEVEFSMMVGGRKRTVVGVAVALLRSADVVFPVGFVEPAAIAA